MPSASSRAERLRLFAKPLHERVVVRQVGGDDPDRHRLFEGLVRSPVHRAHAAAGQDRVETVAV
jgi:hypothetical protein